MRTSRRRINPLPSTTTAAVAFVKSRNILERMTLRDHLLLSYLANRPDKWDFLIKNGSGFSAIPTNVEKIRKVLQIRDKDTVGVAPVFSGEWSKIHPAAIGIDFSKEALRRHPNPYRVKADLRDLPFPDQYFDHLVMYEPTPKNPKVATHADALMTALEAARVARNVHVAQRVRNGLRIWTYPFLEHYFAGLGIPYRITDISDSVQVVSANSPRNTGVHVITYDGKDVLSKKSTITRDLRAVTNFLLEIAKKKTLEPKDMAKLMRRGSPALRKALVEDLILPRKPRLVRRGKHP